MDGRGRAVALGGILGSCVIVLGAVAGRDPSVQAYAYLAVGRILEEIDQVRSPIDLFDEPADAGGPLRLTHGVASGEVTSSSAVIWARADRAVEMHVEYDADPEFGAPMRAPVAAALVETDYTARVLLPGLQPATTYSYRVRAELPGELGVSRSPAISGRFRTAPAADAERPVSFVFSGDLGGGGYCRSIEQGYPIFEAMGALSPQFFLALGDMIYADDGCPTARPGGIGNIPGGFRGVDRPKGDWTSSEEMRQIYLRHWRYNRADPHLQAFLERVPMYPVWDDHEVINDSGVAWSHWKRGTEGWVGYPNLVDIARDAFFDYAPMIRDRAPGRTDRETMEAGRSSGSLLGGRSQPRMYRSFRWGADLEVFLLDLRSHRSRNDQPDEPGLGKTMLGLEQLSWLKRGVRDSSATWKVVASSVPLSAPTGGPAASVFGRDGWASGGESEGKWGFERELLDLLRSFDEARVRNLVFVSGDLHRPLAIRYELDLNGDGERLLFHEFVAGPLSASPREAFMPQLDPTLSPQLLYHDGGFFNFGYARVERQSDGRPHLMVDVRGQDGLPRQGSLLDLEPR